MEWKDVGKVISHTAPVLAGILGGPVGAIVTGAGSLIAAALGCDPTPTAVAEAVKQNPDLAYKLAELEDREKARLHEWKKAQLEAEQTSQEELTKRHVADMNSDSWLSKNVRPMCLLIFTLAIVGGMFVPSVSHAKFQAFSELGYGIYGYYFLGRSIFDKGNVKLNWKKRK